jgi:hypothetical protein
VLVFRNIPVADLVQLRSNAAKNEPDPYAVLENKMGANPIWNIFFR